MGRLHEINGALDEMRTDDYMVRVPLRMVQITEKDGCVWPLSFDWKEIDGSKINVRIDKVISVTPFAEQKSGAVGDRYDCEVNGHRECLFYSKLQPRKWFRLQQVTEDVYNDYYKLPVKPEDKQRARQPEMQGGPNVRKILY